MAAAGVGGGQHVIVPALVDDHVQQRHGGADGHTENGAGRAHGQGHRVAPVCAQHQHRDHKPGDDLEQNLQHLVHGGGQHVAVALAVAPIGRDHAHQQDGRGHGPDAGRGVRVLQINGGQPVGEEKHDGGKDQADDREGGQRHPEGLFLLFYPAVGIRLRHQARQSHGQTRGGQGEENVIDAVGTHKHGIALVPENVAQRNLVEEAQDFHDDHAHGQNGRAVQIVLPFVIHSDHLRAGFFVPLYYMQNGENASRPLNIRCFGHAPFPYEKNQRFNLMRYDTEVRMHDLQRRFPLAQWDRQRLIRMCRRNRH